MSKKVKLTSGLEVLWSVCLWTCARIPPVNNAVVSHTRKTLGYSCSYIDNVTVLKLPVNLLNLYLPVVSPVSASHSIHVVFPPNVALRWNPSGRSRGVSCFLPIWRNICNPFRLLKYENRRNRGGRHRWKSKSSLKSVILLVWILGNKEWSTR